MVSGILLKGNNARFVTLFGSRENHSIESPKFNKLSLPKNPTQDDVEVFRQAFESYCSDNNINLIIVNRRTTRGKHAGGAGSFILEGVLLCISKLPINFVHSATINKTTRCFQEYKSKMPSTKELGKAYELAFEGLE